MCVLSSFAGQNPSPLGISRHDTFIHFSHFQRKNLGFLESQICYSKSFSTLQINEALINNTLVLCFYLFYMLNLCVRQWYYCPALSFCYSWEHMNLKIELQPVFTVNTFPPRLHEVAGPWLSIEKGREGPWKGALCWFRRARGFRLSEVVVVGQQPGLQTLLLADNELPSGVTSPSWTAPWAARSQAGLSWLGARLRHTREGCENKPLVLC